MPKQLLLTTALMVALTPLAGGAEPSPIPSDLETIPVTVGQQISFHSTVLDEERSLLIATPTGYDDSDQIFPVLYVLDGRGQFLHTVASVDLLGRTGHVPGMIVVGVVNVDRNRDFTEINRGGNDRRGGAGAFLEFLAAEVIPLVERSYRTAPYRILVGHSLGGLLAVNAMIERPSLFGAYVGISPAITSDQRDIPKGEKPVIDRLRAALEKQGDLKRDIYLTMSGQENPFWIEDLDRLLEMLEREAPSGFDWQLTSFPDENHTTTVSRSTFDGLRALFLEWNGRDLAATGNLDSLLGHYRALSQRFGYQIDPPEDLINRLGYRHLIAGETDQAIAAFEVNVKLSPASPNVYDSLGEALERRGTFPGALKNYRIACRLAEEADHQALAIFKRNRDRVEARLAERAGTRVGAAGGV